MASFVLICEPFDQEKGCLCPYVTCHLKHDWFLLQMVGTPFKVFAKAAKGGYVVQEMDFSLWITHEREVEDVWILCIWLCGSGTAPFS